LKTGLIAPALLVMAAGGFRSANPFVPDESPTRRSAAATPEAASPTQAAARKSTGMAAAASEPRSPDPRSGHDLLDVVGLVFAGGACWAGFAAVRQYRRQGDAAERTAAIATRSSSSRLAVAAVEVGIDWTARYLPHVPWRLPVRMLQGGGSCADEASLSIEVDVVDRDGRVLLRRSAEVEVPPIPPGRDHLLHVPFVPMGSETAGEPYAMRCLLELAEAGSRRGRSVYGTDPADRFSPTLVRLRRGGGGRQRR
jgi:hypothetical protein